MPNATATTPARAYTARRPESTSSRRPARAPYSDAATPYTASARARISAKRPAVSTGSRPLGLGLELRGALRDQRVLHAHERPTLLADVDHDLSPLAERVRDRALVGDRDRAAALAVLDAEAVDRKSTRLNSSHANISYAVFCLTKKQHDI